jgi:hypothetical protein
MKSLPKQNLGHGKLGAGWQMPLGTSAHDYDDSQEAQRAMLCAEAPVPRPPHVQEHQDSLQLRPARHE